MSELMRDAAYVAVSVVLGCAVGAVCAVAGLYQDAREAFGCDPDVVERR